jgi:glutamine amidotransferase
VKILIIDYGMGNVGSVKRAFEECGAENVTVSNDTKDFEDCTHAVLPGVGAFPDAMNNLIKTGLDRKIKALALDEQVPLLGICLGMQLFANTGYENLECAGLGLIPGVVEPLLPKDRERIPHIGWNQVKIKRADPIFAGIPDDSDFYFVHGFKFEPLDESNIIATTPYCGNFISTIRSNNIIGTQFHPEKSSVIGFNLLSNFLNM